MVNCDDKLPLKVAIGPKQNHNNNTGTGSKEINQTHSNAKTLTEEHSTMTNQNQSSLMVCGTIMEHAKSSKSSRTINSRINRY